MKKQLSLLIIALACTLPLATKAATAGSLIKASGQSVYYLGQDQKRYVFPTEATYKTWYTDFSDVQTISDQELASYALGGNVTYRPGVRLVKITTDPKVYAVGANGTLRWIETEAIATALYGENWAQQVNDIPDSFFVNYHIGTSISSTLDYSPTRVRDAYPTIDINRMAPLPDAPIPDPIFPLPPEPAQPQPSAIFLETSNSSPRVGETFNLRAQAASSTGVASIDILLNNNLQRSCQYYICATDVTIPLSGTQSAYEAKATLHFVNGQSTSTTLAITIGTGSPYVSLTLTRNNIEPQATREMVATAQNNFLAHMLDFYVDGSLVRSCVDQQSCRYSAIESDPVGTNHTVYVIASDSNGTTARSETQTLSVVANDNPVISIEPGKTNILVGEHVDVTVTASDDDGVAETRISLDGQIIKTCSLPTCTANLGPWSQPRSLQVIGEAKDSLGAHSFATSTRITVR